MRGKVMSGRILQFKITSVCLLAVLLCCAGAWAQETTGSIAGTVKDPSGAVVPNAKVTISDSDKNVVVRTLNTGGSGEFSAPGLPIGQLFRHRAGVRLSEVRANRTRPQRQ